jgi:hypothetical protein
MGRATIFAQFIRTFDATTICRTLSTSSRSYSRVSSRPDSRVREGERSQIVHLGV